LNHAYRASDSDTWRCSGGTLAGGSPSGGSGPDRQKEPPGPPLPSPNRRLSPPPSLCPPGEKAAAVDARAGSWSRGPAWEGGVIRVHDGAEERGRGGLGRTEGVVEGAERERSVHPSTGSNLARRSRPPFPQAPGQRGGVTVWALEGSRKDPDSLGTS
jgi:hypothetical protein